MLHIKRYPSVAALATDAAETRPFHLSLVSNAAYFNHETPDDSIAKARRGDTALVATAEKLLSQINAEIDLPERPWISDVAGAYAVVPDFLAGMPDCMRRRDAVETDESPVRIFYCITARVNAPAKTIMRRGVAVLALVIALSRSRAVELTVFNATGNDIDDTVITAPINTQPLDIATAAYALTSAGFVRRLCYNLARHHHFGRRREGLTSYGGTMADLLVRLGGDPSRDLILGPLGLGSAQSDNEQMTSDPVAWVNAQLARFREGVQ